MRSISDMTKMSSEIQHIIKTPLTTPTKEDAIKTLQSCGILDNNNNIKSAYDEIIVPCKQNIIS